MIVSIMLTSFGETRNKRQCVTLYKFYKADKVVIVTFLP